MQVAEEATATKMARSSSSSTSSITVGPTVNPLCLQQFARVATLGFGGFGRVDLCVHQPSNRIVVVKAAQRGPGEHDQHIQRELVALRTLGGSEQLKRAPCPFVVSLVGFCLDQQNAYFALNFVPGGELYSYIQAKPNGFSPRAARFYASEVAVALFYMHNACGVIYRDLKPENILLDAQGHVVLVDFGCARPLRRGERAHTLCGTPGYIPPEVIRGEGHGFEVDTWVFGCLVYELLTGSPPFYAENIQETYNNILQLTAFASEHPNIDLVAADLLSKCLSPDVTVRPQMAQVMLHPWFEGTTWEDVKQKRLPPPFQPDIMGPADTRYYDMGCKVEQGIGLEFFDFPDFDEDVTVTVECVSGESTDQESDIEIGGRRERPVALQALQVQ
eukprot:comp8395_c0_seq1/m.3751 comp8395_c0_seq1/g.3751  ORF comp8395_c0_seq1/g.3751 comp8395_c0_seq1/m.3751 type:complete len:389 (-) comp8395_c0_seq1:458-1624(-)